jgi:hypothetical protein
VFTAVKYGKPPKRNATRYYVVRNTVRCEVNARIKNVDRIPHFKPFAGTENQGRAMKASRVATKCYLRELTSVMIENEFVRKAFKTLINEGVAYSFSTFINIFGRSC